MIAAKPGKRTSRAEAVALRIEDEILEARLPVGAHVARRAELMERFKISPTIMNETLRILKVRGLVSARPGTGGGVFVAALPPQVRLGALDLWFNDALLSPLDLFDTRVILEDALNGLAFERATRADIEAMEAAVCEMGSASGPREFFELVLRFHRAMVAAAQVQALAEFHSAACVLLANCLTRADFIEGYEPHLQHSVRSHHELLVAMKARDLPAFQAAIGEHGEELVRVSNPSRSPHRLGQSAVLKDAHP